MGPLTDKGSNRSYPVDYLYARLRGRLNKGIDYIRKTGHEAADEYINRENQWVYLRMNNRLRERLWPFFFYREIRRVTEWIRQGDISRLELSLFSEEIKEVFLRTKDVTSRIKRLETLLLTVSERFKGLENAFLRGGLKGFEETLICSFLSTVTSITYPPLKKFFRYIIDSRNLIGLYKYMRWNIETVPPFLSGGFIGKDEIRKAFMSGDILKVNQLSSRILEIDIKDLSEPEIGLYLGLREILKKMYITNPIEPVIIPYYLWKLYTEYLVTGGII